MIHPNKKIKHKKSGLRVRLQILAILSVVGLTTGQLGQLYWIFDLFSHFVWCYLIGFFLGIFAFQRMFLKAIMSILFLAMIFWSMPDLLADKSQRKILNVSPISVQLITYNLQFDSFDSSQIGAIKLMDEMRGQSSIVFLSEYSSDFDNVFNDIYKEQYQCAKPEDSPFGIAFYSTLSNWQCAIAYPDETKLFPYIRAEHEDMVVYGIHPPPPINAEMAQYRDLTLSIIATKVRAETKPVIVMGDMNISPYSPIFRRFVKDAGLFETKNRLIPTWLIGMVNIDHILVTKPNHERSRAGWWRGSDHRPVFLNILH